MKIKDINLDRAMYYHIHVMDQYSKEHDLVLLIIDYQEDIKLLSDLFGKKHKKIPVMQKLVNYLEAKFYAGHINFGISEHYKKVYPNKFLYSKAFDLYQQDLHKKVIKCYPEFSDKRTELRKQWNGQGNWYEFLYNKTIETCK